MRITHNFHATDNAEVMKIIKRGHKHYKTYRIAFFVSSAVNLLLVMKVIYDLYK